MMVRISPGLAASLRLRRRIMCVASQAFASLTALLVAWREDAMHRATPQSCANMGLTVLNPLKENHTGKMRR